MNLREPSGTIADQSYLGFKFSEIHRINILQCPGFCVMISVVTTQLDLQWGIATAMALKSLSSLAQPDAATKTQHQQQGHRTRR